ncbi:MAG: TonB-dependent receptor plug domain-containing protein [Caldithrix sp.]|nr:TonB-dependent receptor plug domain-containing protein [Caldithrix sp.]
MNTMRLIKGLFLTIAVLCLALPTASTGQTTGKIAGMVYDKETGDPLAGANVVVEGTSMGAAVGLDGSFYIINVPPDTYTLTFSMVGYETKKVTDLRVSVNRTAYVKLELGPEIMEGDVIVVQADKITNKKDQTSSMRTISSDKIEALPIENVNDVVSMQAGVVNGHFRGGRRNEVSYMIDGLQVDENFGGEGRNVDVETESVQDLEVITGTFNAEYGRAMSGVVNAVIKEGGRDFHGSITGFYSNYVTPHTDIFPGIDEPSKNRNLDYKLTLSGPAYFDNLTFFVNSRYQDNNNHLNGIRRYLVHDYSDYAADNPEQWITEQNGDSSIVPMNNSENLSVLGKLTYKALDNLKLSLLYTRNDDEWHDYNHAFKYVPEGVNAAYRTTSMYSLQVNHMLGNSAFYELKYSYMDNYNGWYLYEDPNDSSYVHDGYLRNNAYTGFFTGGQQKGHNERTIFERNLKFDFNWQATNHHSFKTGIQYINHFIDNRESSIRNLWEGTDNEELFHYNMFGERVYDYYEPIIKGDTTIYGEKYIVKPREFSAYIQDKMEFQEMVINLGMRMDYFDPNTTYPSNRRNPDNSIESDDPDRLSTYPEADAKYQISPRLGLAYQLGKRAKLHFSYGHFFQMPPMYALYQNHSLQVQPTDFATIMGNPQLKSQKTVKYEIGLWQQLNENMDLELSLYYSDIYDLLSMKIISTYNQTEYGLYTNKDYGNVKGLELMYNVAFGNINGNINYTLQYTRGNADYPQQTFDRAGNNQDPVNKLIPMSWDQRHTLNATVGYYKENYGVTATGYYNSGTPYTIDFIDQSRLVNINLSPNNNYQPSTYRVDLTAHYSFNLFSDLRGRFTLNVYNLLDRLNDAYVNPQTGRAYTDIIERTERLSHRSDFNTYLDRVQNPSMYTAPREIKLGFGIEF